MNANIGCLTEVLTVLVSLVPIASLVPVASLVGIASLVIVAIVVIATCITGTICAAPCAVVEAPLQELAGGRDQACACARQKTCAILLPFTSQIHRIHAMRQSAAP